MAVDTFLSLKTRRRNKTNVLRYLWRFLDLDQTHAAVSGYRQTLVVAEPGDLDSDLLAGLGNNKNKGINPQRSGREKCKTETKAMRLLEYLQHGGPGLHLHRLPIHKHFHHVAGSSHRSTH